MATITILNQMGGITYPFLDQYQWTGVSQPWTLKYTPNMAGGSGPGIGCEGWVVNPATGWQPGEPEIFYFLPAVTWYSFNPDTYTWGTFWAFVNGTDGLGGLDFFDGMAHQLFMPLGDLQGAVSAQSGSSGRLRRIVRMSGLATARAASAPPLKRQLAVTGSVSAAGATTGDLTAGDLMWGMVEAQVSLQARLGATRGVSGVTHAQSGHQAHLSRRCALRGVVGGTGAAIGRLGRRRRISGQTDGVGDITGLLHAPKLVAGVVPAAAALTARVTRRRAFSGHAAMASAVTGHARRVRRVRGQVTAQSALGEPVLVRRWWPHMEMMFGPNENMRRLTWNTDETVQIWLDGEYRAHASGGEFILPKDTVIRQFLRIWDEPPHSVQTPLDRGSLSWTGDAPEYQVWRRKDGGPLAAHRYGE